MPEAFKRREIIYKRIHIVYMGANVYHLHIGDTLIHTTYNGGISEIIAEIDEIITFVKGGIK